MGAEAERPRAAPDQHSLSARLDDHMQNQPHSWTYLLLPNLLANARQARVSHPQNSLTHSPHGSHSSGDEALPCAGRCPPARFKTTVQKRKGASGKSHVWVRSGHPPGTQRQQGQDSLQHLALCLLHPVQPTADWRAGERATPLAQGACLLLHSPQKPDQGCSSPSGRKGVSEGHK